MLRPPVSNLGRYIRYWYTYRTAVAVLIAFILSGAMYWLYTQQLACDSHIGNCLVNISQHPEDRFISESNPDPQVVIVGIDDKSLQDIGVFPITRDHYAIALQNLEKDGAQVVAFDIGFPDARDKSQDDVFAQALANTKIPVVLAYGADNLNTGDGKMIATGIDQIPLRKFRCADSSTDPKAPCTQPYPNVVLATTDIQPDADGVTRRIPMFVQPACFAIGSCTTPIINSLNFAAYRAAALQSASPTAGPELQNTSQGATFGQAWVHPLPVDGAGHALINYFGPPGNFRSHGQYVSFGDVYKGAEDRAAINGKIVLVGDYYLTGVHDEILAPTSAGANGTQMAGIEMHANVVQMMDQTKFLSPEPPLIVLLSLLILALITAVVVARMSVLWGLVATVGGIVAFTFAFAFFSASSSFVPDLFHPWLAIALTYSGVTAYRILYEDREKRKVTSIFGQYLKPEIVAELAKTRGGVDEIFRGGERRDLTLLFVDIRGFTTMSESMVAEDVVTVITLYLDHLSKTIFQWDGTIDKYVGDEIVAMWNAPRLQENHALLAVRCAYDMIAHAPDLQHILIAKGLPPIRWGIGVNTGPAVVGNLGSSGRLQYTALGDTVNTAARFCSAAPPFHLLIGQHTYEQCKDYIAVDLVPGVQLKGKSAETFRIYQVTAIRESPTSPWVQFPTEMASAAHQTFTQQFTQQTILAAANTGSNQILIGTEAEGVLAGQPAEGGEPAPPSIPQPPGP